MTRLPEWNGSCSGLVGAGRALSALPEPVTFECGSCDSACACSLFQQDCAGCGGQSRNAVCLYIKAVLSAGSPGSSSGSSLLPLQHSCTPNLFVQNVFVDTHDLRFPWVAFFASK